MTQYNNEAIITSNDSNRSDELANNIIREKENLLPILLPLPMAMVRIQLQRVKMNGRLLNKLKNDSD